MEKLSSQKVLSILSTIPETLRKLASERDELQSENVRLVNELNGIKLHERVEKIAHEVHEKGIEQGRSFEETKELLLEKAASGDLDVIENAVQLTVANTPLGHLGDRPSGTGTSFEEFIVS